MVWAVSLSTTKLSPRRLTRLLPPSPRAVLALGVWLSVVTSVMAPSPSSALPPGYLAGGCTCMHFGENQLSPGSVGISPLRTGHPPVLQHGWVRASTDFHIRFTLPMRSSPGFGSHRGHPRAPFGLGCPPAPALYRALTWHLRCTRRIILQKARHQPSLAPPSIEKGALPASDCLQAHGFRFSFIPLAGCFSPFPHGTGPLSVAAAL